MSSPNPPARPVGPRIPGASGKPTPPVGPARSGQPDPRKVPSPQGAVQPERWTEASQSAARADRPVLLRWIDSLGAIPTPIKLLVVLLGPFLGMGFALLLPAKTRPNLTEGEWQTAQQIWQARALKDYTLEVEFTAYMLTGPQITRYQAEVKDGEVTELLKDGETAPSPQNWKQWAVDQLLADIGKDLESRRNGTFVVAEGTKVSLYGTFDKDFGYPLTYRKEAAGNPDNYSYKTKLTPTK